LHQSITKGSKFLYMFKTKVKFDPKSLRFEKVPFSLKRLIMLLIPHSFVSLISAVAMLTVYMVFFETPEEQLLRAENRYLRKNFKEMSSKFTEMNVLLEDMAGRDNELYRSIYQLDSIPQAVRNSGFGGSQAHEDLEGYTSSWLVIDVANKIDVLSKKLNIQANSYKEITEMAMLRTKRLQSIPVLQPINNSQLNHIGSFYGYRKHPVFNTIQMHHGIDYVAETGTPVFASGDGVVTRIEKNRSRSGYGNLVIIDHGVNGLSSYYAHLNSIDVNKNDKIKRGQQIGTVGNTGLSTAPHLHFEVRINGESVDPLKYIISVTPKQYDDLLKMSKMNGGVSFD